MRYYKAMNKDLTCRDFQYEIGKTYELPKDVELKLCENGFHFCDILNACFNYYNKDNSIICEVEPLGEVIHDEYDNKLVTDKIKIVRQLSDEEVEEQRYIIQDGVTFIGNSTFYNCTSLKEITIPNSVTYIGNSTFCNCTSLKEINIPNNVTFIGNDAFAWCINLKEITIPNSVTYINKYAFYNCNSLETICVPTDFDIEILENCELKEEIPLLKQVKIIRI